MSADMEEREPKQLLLDAIRMLARAGIVDHSGHGSVRRDRASFYINSGASTRSALTAADIVACDLDGTLVEGEAKPPLEFHIHSEIYRARDDVHAVVHTHPEHATAFSSLRVPLLPISHEACLFVPPDVPRFSETTDLIVTAALGRAVASALGPTWAVLLENHGVVTAGATVADAALRAFFLEKAARLQLLAGGREQTWTSDGEALAKRAHVYAPRGQANVWAYLTRRHARRRG